MDELAGVLGKAGQQLSLDVPAAPGGAGRGTVGGVLAAAAAGPRRLRYGTPRDLSIGITVVLADGTVAHSGGKVVKNVAGYDIGKLFAGSFGTLGLIVEAAFRLHPVPAATAFVSRDCVNVAAAQEVVAAAVDSPLAPSAVEIDRAARSAPVRVSVLLEGDKAGVAERSALLRDLLGGGARISASPPPWWGRGAVTAAGSTDAETTAAGGTLLRITFWAAELAAVAEALDAASMAAGLDPFVGGSAAAGVIYASVPGGGPATAVAGLVAALRSAAPLGAAANAGEGPPARGSVVVLQAPPQVRDVVDVWGPVPSAALMRAIKDQFDPGHRMAPGRMPGGI